MSKLKRDKTFTQPLLEWFREHGRELPWRKPMNAYRVLVTEKLLQQTSFGHVLKVYRKFFEKYHTVEALAASNEAEIEKVIKRLGFQRQRAHQFKETAEKIMNEFKGEIPNVRTKLLTLSGVGSYVADAILCYAYGKKIVPVDVNVRRVASRLFDWERKPSDPEIQQKMNTFVPTSEARAFNWALLDFAAKICSRVPKCGVCFAKKMCHHYQRLND